MKKLLLILLCLPMIFSCGEKKENDLTADNIKGKVKELIETSFNVKEAFGDLEKDDFKSKWKSKYDEDGNRTESSSYDKDGELSYKWKFKYNEFDKKNNWIVRTEYDDDTPTTIIEREIEYY